MSWEPWSRADSLGLARYVTREDVARFLRLDEPAGPDTPRDRLAAVYQRLAEAGIRYAAEEYHPGQARQYIRTPAELLSGQGRGTCLDLAALMCGVCLGHDLIPVLVVLNGHAIVAVSATHSLSGWDDYDRDDRESFVAAQLTDPAELRRLVDQGILIPLECTGFSAATGLPESLPEGQGRDGGLLTFERAVQAGREQLDRADRPLAFALDVTSAWFDLGITPYRTGGRLRVSLGGGLLLEVGADGVQQVTGPAPTVRAYPRPVQPQVPQPRHLAGRDGEIGAVRERAAPGTVVFVQGDPGSGRTTLLRGLAHEDWRDRYPDGVVYLDAGDTHPDDLVYALFEALYLTDVPFRPEPEHLAEFLADVRALVLVDDADRHAPTHLNRLAATMPGTAVVATTRAPQDTGVTVPLAGLPVEAAVTMLAAATAGAGGAAAAGRAGVGAAGLAGTADGTGTADGAGGAGQTPDAIVRIAVTLRGHPADLRIAATLIGNGTFTPDALASWLAGEAAARPALVTGLLRTLPAQARDALSLLASCDERMTRQHVAAILGPVEAEEGLRALRRTGLLTTDAPYVRLDRSLAELVRAVIAAGPWLDRAVDHVSDWVVEHGDDIDRLLADAPLLLRAVEEAAARGRDPAVETIARKIAPALTVGARWGARGIVLGLAAEVGRHLGTALALWAHHQVTPAGPPAAPAHWRDPRTPRETASSRGCIRRRVARAGSAGRRWYWALWRWPGCPRSGS